MDDLSGPRLLAGLAGTRFRHVEVHASVDSTQTLLVAEGGRDGRVVVADHQTAGRGRAGRSWTDVPGAMLMFSALLRGVPVERSALVGLAAGVAVARAVGNDARLKWPNDVRIGGRKMCGILGELAPWGDHVVVGIGVNVGHAEGDLPAELEATSLRIASGDPPPRRDDLCVAILRELDALVGSDFIDDYRALCETIGSRVRVELSDRTFEGIASDVRDDGALIVDGDAVVAGDVVHVR
ncbi:MAG: biotin--[acetyl-CoA-carboxylase] ligase [Actinobacteria bacterium]|nr:biotin--[acetyl-CoA-carboxylase] ligase [Actinomycetota bacterium]